ncbi:shikimate kinase [Paenibacillus shirakamiensis]|uniref:Shikimate kinase n=1 Tax=Paenibacillus shirakamiensis TaxID=1265935 RepID=A0ABS4JC53_9BACL|nr:shikimate kinase [Paenibacillus shirakamiensis]MBP1999308.1 shikimate kinase [Paenibacillus shirakamiensis]
MNQPKGNIILIGMMGTGKSTVGELLARQTGHHMVDLDHLIQVKAGKSIPEIFEDEGELYFRDLESEVLAELMEQDGLVVATGGGAVLRHENCTVMLNRGWVVALQADAESIMRRVGEDPNRPLLAGGARERIIELLEERKSSYNFAHQSIDTAGLCAEEVTMNILMHYRV